MNLSAIIQLIIAIPKLIDIFMGLWNLVKDSQSKAVEKDQQNAIEEMKKAKTEEEIKNANKKITSNLP